MYRLDMSFLCNQIETQAGRLSFGISPLMTFEIDKSRSFYGANPSGLTLTFHFKRASQLRCRKKVC